MENLQYADILATVAYFAIGLLIGFALPVIEPAESVVRKAKTVFVEPIREFLKNRQREKTQKINGIQQSPEFIRSKDAENINRRLSELDISGWRFKGYSKTIDAKPIFVREDGAEVSVDDFGRDRKLSALRDFDAANPITELYEGRQPD